MGLGILHHLCALALATLTAPAAALSSLVKTRAALQLENLALRHQLGVLHRPVKKPKLTPHSTGSSGHGCAECGLMAAPLIFSGDMNYLDDFTLNVLCNSEVIDVDQDVLGKQGRIVRHTDAEFVLARPMADGSLAVGFFNLSNGQRNVAATLSELGLAGGCRVRDLWRQRDTGDCNGQYTAPVKAPLGISRPPVSSGR